jgi:hypothetical protein
MSRQVNMTGYKNVYILLLMTVHTLILVRTHAVVLPNY